MTKVSIIVWPIALSIMPIQNASRLKMIFSQTLLLPKISLLISLSSELIIAIHYNTLDLMKKMWWY
jgi:hypothetical protein